MIDSRPTPYLASIKSNETVNNVDVESVLQSQASHVPSMMNTV